MSPYNEGEADVEGISILAKPGAMTWNYDEDAAVLYIAVGEPQPAVGVDIGEGLVLRYDETRREVVGLTIIGLRARLLKGLAETSIKESSSSTR